MCLINPFLEYAGPPSVPSNLSHHFRDTCNGTHLPTTISWLLPQRNENHHSAEALVLSYIPTTSVDVEEPLTMVLANDSTSATVFLAYNEIYNISIYATSCGERLKSDNTSITITTPEFEGMNVVAKDPFQRWGV
jgi:hypothetical protein